MKDEANKGTVTKRGVLDRLDSVNEWVGRVICYLIPAIIAIITYEVVMRYGFDSPTKWVHDLSSCLQFSFIILGGGYALLYRGHVKVDVLYSRFSPRTKFLFDAIVGSILFFCFTGALFWKGIPFALQSLEMRELFKSGIFPGPVYPFKLLYPVGVFLIMFQWVLNLVRDFRLVRAKNLQ